MYRLIEYCPHCHARQGIDLSLGLIPFHGPDGIEEILVYHYHCAVCNSHIRSTTMDHKEYIRPKESVVFSIPEYGY
jgi:C4-type Zn-finger protein